MTLSAYKLWQLLKPRRRFRDIARSWLTLIGSAHHTANPLALALAEVFADREAKS